MKKIKSITFIVFFCLACFLRYDEVYADTYNVDELKRGDFIQAGDIIEVGSGVYEGYNYSGINVCEVRDGAAHTLPFNTATRDCYISYIWVTTSGYIEIELGEFALLDESKTITVNEGDNVTLTTNVVGFDTNTYEYLWRENEIDITDWSSDLSTYTLHNVTYNMNGNQYYYIAKGGSNNRVLAPSKTSASGLSTQKVTLNVIAKEKEKQEESKEEPKEVHNEPTKTPEQIESERKNKDTLPSGTIQGIGGKKDFNFKALNPVQRDVNNQQIFADYYAKQLGFKSELLISKDIYAPYGQTKESKWQSRTISWKNTGAKFGDLIYVVWYCQEAHEMQFIQANVLPDGTVVFTIPKSGDVSTISIVKLNK